MTNKMNDQPQVQQNQETREWSDLPVDLVQYIADKLGIIEFLTFRKICRSWRSATTTSTAAGESIPNREPWFLLRPIESDPECKLIHESNPKHYTISILDLIDAEIYESKQGWLLCLQSPNSMFFLCPFTGAKILLPDLKFMVESNKNIIIASFSSDPLSPDCIVAALAGTCINNQRIVECWEIRRGGGSDWIQRGESHYNYEWNKQGCTVFHNEVFYFCSDNDKLFRFNTREGSLSRCGHICPSGPGSKGRSLPLRRDRKGHFGKFTKIMGMLGLSEDFKVFVWGTVINGHDDKFMMVHAEYPKEDRYWDPKEKIPQAVWIQPRLHRIDEGYRW